MLKTQRAILLATVLGSFAGVAHAEESWIGISLGAADLQLSSDDKALFDPDASAAYGVFAQGIIKHGLGFELAAMRMPEFDLNPKNSTTEGEVSTSTFEAAGLYQHWIAQRIAVTGKLGAAYWRSRTKLTSGGTSTRDQESGTAATAGLGLAIRAGDDHFFRVMAQHYSEMPEDTNTNVIRLEYAHRL